MSSRRLTDSDKQDIVELYRQPGHTTLTLAEQYGVSNTTISRILKTSLSSDEYERLIQQKRTARFSSEVTVQGNLLEPEPVAAEPLAEVKPIVEPEPRKVTAPVLRRSSTMPQSGARQRSLEAEDDASEPLVDSEEVGEVEKSAPTVKKVIGADLLLQTSDGLDDEDDEDDEDDLDSALSGEFDDEDEEDGDDVSVLPSIHLSATEFIHVLPIAEAAIPRTCYLVVDRSAELVARPLSEFVELGQIPSDEIQERTLPVFDNHRVARRFSNIRTQRVIKVPDSRVLQKAAPHLQAKGITRLLIDGQVYAL
ncbi:transposase [Myxacorys almedinensis]|uniref:Transposase n=1 Tax=Myxacorys almedinensis A TaxID=2690445 RepID=A0A8J8CJ58_9CYAN|nr:transposase [Myxacorys almedinensis]NDJ18319.1 transposase [Myxacorys almedinensis A]